MAREQHPGAPVVASGLPDPLPQVLDRALRRAVLDHVTSEHRRSFPPVVRLGTPGAVAGAVELTVDDPRPDHALRVDLLEAMVRRLHRLRGDGDSPLPTGPLVWLTRRGGLEVQDLDLEWSSSARTASYELGLALAMVVVTRQGWRDPFTGATRTWRRLRAPR